MIYLYTAPFCDGSLRARKWFKDHKLNYEEHNLLKEGDKLNKVIFDLIPLLDGNLTALLSTRSKHYSQIKTQLERMKLSEWIDYLSVHPEILRHPIIYDGVEHLQIGFNSEEIRSFIPRQYREIARHLNN